MDCAPERDVQHAPGFDCQSAVGRFGLEHLRAGRHRDGLSDLAHRHLHVHHGALGDLQRHAFADGLLEAGLFHRHDVLAGGQKGDLVVSVVARCCGGHLAGIGVPDVNLCAGNRSARGIGDAAGKGSAKFLRIGAQR